MSDSARPSPGLKRYGFNERWEALFAPMAEEGYVLGRVTRVDRGLATVASDRGTLTAEPAAHLVKTHGMGSRFAVGDWVALAVPEGHERAIIEAILPRTSAFVRKDPGLRDEGQVVAANVDVVFIVQSLAPRGVNVRRLERELVLTWDSGATPVVVLTKSDLITDPRQTEEAREAVARVAPGVHVHVVSGLTGDHVDELRRYTEDDATVVLIGASGVGKSTLVNRLLGEDVQAVGALRRVDGRGRHTTVARELVLLPESGVLIDTPGMRALALWDAEEGMSAAFSDIESIAEACRFRDCTHTAEPGCAVLGAVQCGDIAQERLDSYRRLTEELQERSARQEARLRAERDQAAGAAAKAARRFRPGERKRGGEAPRRGGGASGA